MAIFKCKMCGGTLEINNNETVAVCEYCGTKQTLPKLDDERKASLYDRANYFRRENEFDKAMGIYEMILNEDYEDSESYWGIVLCRYGIEYVEDPVTHKRVPTVNRAQFTSIYDDEHYKKAYQYADGYQRDVYAAEAKVIDDIQKGILEISRKEEPFDVFICYKETDRVGNRTQDSVYAQDIYKALTKEGYKVFFSRITLEDKLGTAYEPYIFAALNSAKVMLVVGTEKDNFNAVWVKNEWSRFLSLIKAGKDKALIPVYKDISPYDMPEEFQYLQSQDMSKIGFMQDLIRGISKLIDVNRATSNITTINDEMKESIYNQGCTFLSKGVSYHSVEYLEEAKKNFNQIIGFRDALSKIDECQSEIVKLNRAREIEQDDKKKKFAIIAVAVAICLIISSIVIFNKKDSPQYGEPTSTTTFDSSDELIDWGDSNDVFEESTTSSTTTTTTTTTTKKEETTYFNSITPGQKVKFGSYEQDGDTSNGKEELVWWAASVNAEARQALLISYYIIDFKPFNDTLTDVTWENCSMRKWLNGSFLNSSFSAKEKKQMLAVKVENYNNPQDGTNCGKDTYDKVFLLSYDEVVRFYPDSSTRVISTTPYAQTKVSSSVVSWWVRTSGMGGNSYAMGYMTSRFANTWGTFEVNDSSVGVVPVILISY